MEQFIYFYDTPVGRLGIAQKGGGISHVLFENKQLNGFELLETDLIKTAKAQLFEYFDKKRTSFSLPLSINVTPFQSAVLTALQSVPYGKTYTYKELAAKIGNPKAVRAVGMANNRNPLPIIIPCHRVIGSNGKLIGYAGGLKIKEHLLNLEK